MTFSLYSIEFIPKLFNNFSTFLKKYSYQIDPECIAFASDGIPQWPLLLTWFNSNPSMDK